MKKYDITVVGGGFAGICAAIAAARAGKKVLLLEKTGMLGGAASNCLVLPFMRYFTNMKTPDGGKENFDLVRGIFSDFISEITKSVRGTRQYYNIEYFRIVLDRMVRKSGTDVLFFSTVTVTALILKTCCISSGRTAIVSGFLSHTELNRTIRTL